MSLIRYRPDIDGLRAVAVLSVILYHAGVPYVTGGFVGVDVFFVISGYLITSLLLKEMETGQFTFADFWIRRARRILPALSVMVIATLIVGYFLLLPQDYKALGKEAAAQAIFMSNFLFSKEAGYFDVSSFLKPLLHTWSLAVEEQFYLLYPLVLFFVHTQRPAWLKPFLIFSAFVSFALCLFAMEYNKDAAFYWLPFRGWELLCGAIVASGLPLKGPRKVWAELFAVIAVAAIIVPVFFYNEDTLFPGWSALPPCLGAALLIWTNGHKPTIVGKFLSWRPVVFVGLVSYSWYLWHWPVIVFTKYNPFITMTAAVIALCVAGSFVLAVLSWQYIERPFRKKTIKKRAAFCYAILCLVFLAFFGGGISLLKGLPQRMSAEVLRYASGTDGRNPDRKCDSLKISDIKKDKTCLSNPDSGIAPSFMLWGDSYADAAAPLFVDLSKKYHRNGYIVTHSGCSPIIGYSDRKWRKGYNCEEFNKEIFNFIVRNKVHTLFLIASWSSRFSMQGIYYNDMSWYDPYAKEYQDLGAAGIQYTLDMLRNAGIKIYLVKDTPHAELDPPRSLAIGALHGYPLGALEGDAKIYRTYTDKRIGSILSKSKNKDIVAIDPGKIFCDDLHCKIEVDGNSLYYNPSHISVQGALYLEPLFEPYFKKGFSKP